MVFLEWSIVPQVEPPLAAVTCSITGGEFKSFTRTTLGHFIFLSYCAISLFFFPILFSRALEIPVFLFSFSVRLNAGFCLFLFQLRLLCNYSLFSDLLFTRPTGCMSLVLISACYVIFTCLLHIVAFFFRACPSILFPWLSLCFTYLIVSPRSHFALGFLSGYHLVPFFAYKALIFRGLTEGPTVFLEFSFFAGSQTFPLVYCRSFSFSRVFTGSRLFAVFYFRGFTKGPAC